MFKLVNNRFLSLHALCSTFFQRGAERRATRTVRRKRAQAERTERRGASIHPSPRIRLCLRACVKACLSYLDGVVVGARDEVGPVAAAEVAHAVDAALVALQREVRLARVEAPHLHARCESARRACATHHTADRNIKYNQKNDYAGIASHFHGWQAKSTKVSTKREATKRCVSLAEPSSRQMGVASTAPPVAVPFRCVLRCNSLP